MASMPAHTPARRPDLSSEEGEEFESERSTSPRARTLLRGKAARDMPGGEDELRPPQHQLVVQQTRSAHPGPAPVAPELRGTSLEVVLPFRENYRTYLHEVERFNERGGNESPRSMVDCVHPSTQKRIRLVHIKKINKDVLDDQTLSETLDFLVREERETNDKGLTHIIAPLKWRNDISRIGRANDLLEQVDDLLEKHGLGHLWNDKDKAKHVVEVIYKVLPDRVA